MGRSQNVGWWAERRAARLLRRNGLKILGRNVRCGRQEIDVLASNGSVVVIVEVRYRARGLLAADLSVDRNKERKLWAAWLRLRRDRQLPVHLCVRFDLVLVGDHGPAVHLPGALLQRSR